MKNKRKTFLALLLAAAVLTGALAGCAGTQDETQDETQDIQVSDSISGEKLTAGARRGQRLFPGGGLQPGTQSHYHRKLPEYDRQRPGV